MKREKLTPVEQLMAGMDRCALARGNANYMNGYRAGRPDKEAELYETERDRWRDCATEEARFRRLCARLLREASRKRSASNKGGQR